MINYSYLNKVRFSSLKSRELRVMQSWSNTKGCEREKNTLATHNKHYTLWHLHRVA